MGLISTQKHFVEKFTDEEFWKDEATGFTFEKMIPLGFKVVEYEKYDAVIREGSGFI